MILWENGIFHTMENEKSKVNKVLTDQGLIIAVDDEIDHYKIDHVIDLNGAHVYPGFVDAHMHLLGYGRMLSRPNLSSCKTKEEALSIIKESFNGKPLFVEGYRESGITKHDLNQISKDVPICVRHNDYHSLTTNDAILSISNLLHTNGVLTEEEATLAMNNFPRHSKDELKAYLNQSLDSLVTYGITGAHSDDLAYYNSYQQTYEVFEEVLKNRPFRAHLLVHHEVLDDHLKSNRLFLDQTPYLQLGAIKMFYDGTVSSKTALMKDHYEDSNSKGLLIHSKNEFERLVQKCRNNDLPVAIHVIGDQGLEDVADILLKYPATLNRRDRIIHAPWATKKSILTMKKLSMAIDIQPQFLSSDLPWAFRFFSKKPEFVFPWKTYLKEGLILAGSSDAPVEIPNPLLGISAAIYRRSDHDHMTYHTSESLTPFEAISLYTVGANYPTYHDNRGYIKKGYIADFTIFSHDLLTLSENELKNEKVKMTVIDEKIVYKQSN